MESDESKLFVGGISRDTNEVNLKDHFNKYGNVLSSVVAKDKNTKTHRGFAFVQFSEPSSVGKALQDTHVILGRRVEVKKAIPRSEQHQQQQPHHNLNQQWNSRFIRNGNDAPDSNNHFRTKKVFVGGLSANLTEEEFKNYFERFGRITDVVVMHDSSTNRPRGFGFVTFESEESVDNVMQQSFHHLNKRLVEVKRAVPKEGNNISIYGNKYMKAGRISRYNCYQAVEYSSNGHGYGIYPGYAPLPGYNGVGGYLYGTGVYNSGYPMVGYGRMGYGVTPDTPRCPSYMPVMPGARVCLLPYGTACLYPPYMNGGVGLTGVVPGGFNGIIGNGVDGKWNHFLGGFGALPANAMLSESGGVKLGSDNSGSRECGGSAASEQDQKGLDGHLKPLSVDASR